MEGVIWVEVRAVSLLEELLDAHVLLGVLLHDLGHGHLEVLLGHVHPPLPVGGQLEVQEILQQVRWC